jgi:hypothetical protein
VVERRLDVSSLEPPEPLVLTLEQAETLRPGEYLRMLHRRKPCLLYERLERAGFLHDTRNGRDAECEVFIWRRGDEPAEAAAREAAGLLPPWQE